MSMDSTPPSKDSLTNSIKKEDPTIHCLQETHLIDRKKHWIRAKGGKKSYQANGHQKQAGVAIHKASLKTYKKTEITPCLLSDHNALKLELNNENNSRKYANNWRLNNTLLNNQGVRRNQRGNQKVPGS
jgi:exonuclease III